VGAAALEGRPGIIDVKKGWLGASEVDRVEYDPNKVAIEQMEIWLRDAGTYIRTVRNKP
jgi:hypothetical protein